jgi:hypothetical protein
VHEIGVDDLALAPRRSIALDEGLAHDVCMYTRNVFFFPSSKGIHGLVVQTLSMESASKSLDSS